MMTGGPPARPINLPSGVSKQVSPASVCQASGSSMLMRWCCHSWIESRLHVLHHILFVRGDGERTYFGDTLAGRRAPTFIFNREQPNLAIGLNDDATRPSRCVGCRARRVHVQMPKYLRLCDLADGCMSNDPASDIVDTDSFANRPTNLCRGRRGQAYQNCNTRKSETD